METRCTCGKGHPTFGACVRAKNLGFPGAFPTRSEGYGSGDRSAQRAWDSELDYYRTTVGQGIEPAGTRRGQIEAAERVSQEAGKAYDATTGTFKE